MQSALAVATGHHMEAVTGRLSPKQKLNHQEFKMIFAISGHKPIISKRPLNFTPLILCKMLKKNKNRMQDLEIFFDVYISEKLVTGSAKDWGELSML